MLLLNGDLELECHDCGSNKFVISLQFGFTTLTCMECQAYNYFRSDKPIIDTKRIYNQPINPVNIDNISL